MKEVDKILNHIEECIRECSYKPVETEKIELKPTPPNLKGAKALLQSVCAFLNSNGGILILGIKEKINVSSKHYELTGYSEDFESVLKDIGQQFTDKNFKKIDVSEYIVNHEIREFMEKRVCVMYIDKLPEDNKFAFFEKVAYRREFTGDHAINENVILAHEEFKEEIRNARELKIVPDANVGDIDLDKLNAYIQILNRETKVETMKAGIEDAKAFLSRRKFIIGNDVTTLGMLVCGSHVKDFLGWRSQVDGYVDTPFEVAQDKKSLIDNVIPLMEKSLGYILKNIQVGVSIEKGGTSKPEYPEQLIRETINNALAHRDYSLDKYVNIDIKPNQHIEIRNPGSFKQTLLIELLNSPIPIRRIIPDSKPRNPKLADVLKVFDKWEGKSRGMGNLVNEALNNKIDLPYYRFHSKDELSLFVRKGKLCDEKMESFFTAYNGYIKRKLNGEDITSEQKQVLSYFYKSELENKNDRYTILLTKDNNHFKAINSLEEANLIFRHPISNELYPVFLVDRELFKSSYINELRKIFGADYDILTQLQKIALNCIYEFNTYSEIKYPSANIVGNTLWAKKENENNLKDFEAFKRDVRKSIQKMTARGIIKKFEDKNQYELNLDFKRRPSIWDEKENAN
jgi:predicted HTH transcriptional regulator